MSIDNQSNMIQKVELFPFLINVNLFSNGCIMQKTSDAMILLLIMYKIIDNKARILKIYKIRCEMNVVAQ